MAVVTYQTRPGRGGKRSSGEAVSRILPFVKSTRSGLLICDDDNSAWCPHIEDVIKSNSDSRSIFDDFRNEDVRYIEVPVIPTAGVFARVHLECLVSHDMLVWVEPPMDSKEKSPSKAGTKLGILCKDEGRLALRAMVIDWIDMIRDSGEYLTCAAMCHSRLRQVELLSRMSVRSSALVETWNLGWYKKCTMCLIETGPELAFDADLIPPRP